MFEEKRDLEAFQLQIREVPQAYRKRKAAVEHLDITFSEEQIQEIKVTAQLTRIYKDMYGKIEGDPDPSDECDGLSVISESYVSAAEPNPLVLCQLIDHPKSNLMFGNKVEKCHLKSQSAFPDSRNNPNNILYMSRHLHEHFDGINKIEGVPSFYVQYIDHEVTPTEINNNGATVVVYETQVLVKFLTEEYYGSLGPYFKDYTVVGEYD